MCRCRLWKKTGGKTLFAFCVRSNSPTNTWHGRCYDQNYVLAVSNILRAKMAILLKIIL
jgi:hypothetical protein